MDDDPIEVDVSDVSKCLQNDPEFLNEVLGGTRHYPGTEGKIDIMMTRYASGLPLWNVNDVKRPSGTDAIKQREACPFDWIVLSENDELPESPEDSLTD